MRSARSRHPTHHKLRVVPNGADTGVKPLRRDPRRSDVGGRGLRPPAPSTLILAVRPSPNLCQAASTPLRMRSITATELGRPSLWLASDEVARRWSKGPQIEGIHRSCGARPPAADSRVSGTSAGGLAMPTRGVQRGVFVTPPSTITEA